uniref:Protein PIH1D3-like n=1 Tax=Phallusia mammillata TaxID=59560 RepID=A0A6F9DPQ4_9ASCI|nr:protein PIH1D3-like [Phallusia mammillata]
MDFCDSTVERTNNLMNLCNLLNTEKDNSSDDDEPDLSQPAFTPGAIGTKKNNGKQLESPYVKSHSNSNDIWADEEVGLQQFSVYEDESDPRPSPNYNISYKQKVTSQDMFLGMSGKNPSSACCEEMTIKIILPATEMKDVELDVKENFLACRSPKHRLMLSLPHPVHPKQGSAKWNGKTETLEVTLVMNREYDFVNFQ